MYPIRIGYGYDTHRLEAGRKLILGGVEIPFEKGLHGHSDADVLLHAICDALLGALNLRDIGYHFPNTDPRYKNTDSRIFLTDTYKIVQEKGFTERPKINPHIPAMQKVIAELLETEAENISLKATTNERLDAVGEERGMIAHAVVLLYMKKTA